LTPWLWPEPWIDTAVLFTALLFGVEGSFLPPLASQPEEQGMLPVPHSLPALAVVAVILALSLLVARGSVKASTSSIPQREAAWLGSFVALVVLTLGSASGPR
jgi:hypothetical protein